MLKLINDVYYVTIGRHAGRTLAWCVQWRSGWLNSWALCTGGVTQEEIAIVDAAIAERTRRMTEESKARRLAREAPRVSLREFDQAMPNPVSGR